MSLSSAILPTVHSKPSPEDAETAEGHGLPRLSPLAIAMRGIVVVSILAWFGLRRVVGLFTESITGRVALRSAFE